MGHTKRFFLSIKLFCLVFAGQALANNVPGLTLGLRSLALAGFGRIFLQFGYIINISHL